MLAGRYAQFGVSLVEVVVGVVIVAILMATGLPSFSGWIQSSSIRTTAESVQNGLQLARAEAVRRNTLVRFQLTDSAIAGCAISAGGTSWVVSLDDPSGVCNSSASDTVAPRIIRIRTGAEGSSNVVVAADQSVITFNGSGRVTPIPVATINIALTNPTGGACAAAAGPMRCLNITVSTGGQVRMCDPALTSADPRGC